MYRPRIFSGDMFATRLLEAGETTISPMLMTAMQNAKVRKSLVNATRK